MTKQDLVHRVADATQRSKREAEETIDAVLTSLADALSKGERVDLRGFGNFQVSQKKERQGRNPKTGEPITIAARKAAVFKPSRELTDRLNAASATAETAVAGDTLAQPSPGPAKVHGDKIEV